MNNVPNLQVHYMEQVGKRLFFVKYSESESSLGIPVTKCAPESWLTVVTLYEEYLN